MDAPWCKEGDLTGSCTNLALKGEVFGIGSTQTHPVRFLLYKGCLDSPDKASSGTSVKVIFTRQGVYLGGFYDWLILFEVVVKAVNKQESRYVGWYEKGLNSTLPKLFVIFSSESKIFLFRKFQY